MVSTAILLVILACLLPLPPLPPGELDDDDLLDQEVAPRGDNDAGGSWF